MPIPATEEHLKGVDCEFEQAGTPAALVSIHGGAAVRLEAGYI
ncbi:MAG: hypothetical protein OXN89_24815 [Bryobacterales bacterium]|nr:hypothetical protein [Bryobacterales bacterium]